MPQPLRARGWTADFGLAFRPFCTMAWSPLPSRWGCELLVYVRSTFLLARWTSLPSALRRWEEAVSANRRQRVSGRQVLAWDRLLLTGEGLRPRLSPVLFSFLFACGREMVEQLDSVLLSLSEALLELRCMPGPLSCSALHQPPSCSGPLWIKLTCFHRLLTTNGITQPPSVPPPVAATLRGLLAHTDDDIIAALRGYTTASDVAPRAAG